MQFTQQELETLGDLTKSKKKPGTLKNYEQHINLFLKESGDSANQYDEGLVLHIALHIIRNYQNKNLTVS